MRLEQIANKGRRDIKSHKGHPRRFKLSQDMRRFMFLMEMIQLSCGM